MTTNGEPAPGAAGTDERRDDGDDDQRRTRGTHPARVRSSRRVEHAQKKSASARRCSLP
jgi:hypothetical protein